jgi:hypothetical protein
MKTVYSWVCHDDLLVWEREYDLGKAPSRTRCPQCNKLCGRDYGSINVSWGNDKDFHTVKQRYRKHEKYGFDKDSANRFLRRHIEKSRDAQNDESYRYKSASIDYKKLAEDGHAKRLNDKETSEKVERCRKLTVDAYDRANKAGYKDIGQTKLNISKQQKNK